jgi:hypothetical protein
MSVSPCPVRNSTGQGEADVPEDAGYVHKPFSPSELLERLSELE